MTYTGKIQVLRDITEEILDEHLNDAEAEIPVSEETSKETILDDDFESFRTFTRSTSQGI